MQNVFEQQTNKYEATSLARSTVLQRKCACGQHTSSNGSECEECTKKRQGMLQRATVNNSPTNEVPSIVHEVLHSPGQPLDVNTRAFMEPRFGHDFSSVRVHTDAKAAESARSVNALAYTVGRDVAFACGQYAPAALNGKRLLVHELAHVVQQGNDRVMPGMPLTIGPTRSPLEREADRFAERLEYDIQTPQEVTRDPLKSYDHTRVFAPGLESSFSQSPLVLIQRKEAEKEKKTGKTKTAKDKPDIKFTFGEVRFSDEARSDHLKGGALLPGLDNSHTGLSADGRLGYDANYTEPTDPFRWEKIKFLINSGQKILIKKVALLDQIEIRSIEPDKPPIDIPDWPMQSEGLTLPTEALQRRIYPAYTGSIKASPNPDTHLIYYTTDPSPSNPDRSALAHELFGHMWLALREVPWVHPKEQADIIARGTIETKHGISDPFGGVYTGTVRDFIDRYIGSEQISRFKSPTRFVGKRLLEAAIRNLKKDFANKSEGKLNGPWQVDDDLGLIWETISANYEIAQLADPNLQQSIEQDLANWYESLTTDQQYVFIMYLKVLRKDFTRKTKLASEILKKLKAPTGMRELEQ